MKATKELIKWNAARQAIIEAKTVDEVKSIKDKAEAMRAYAKQVGESLEVQNNICEIKLRAERKIGQMSKDMPKAQGTRTDTSVHRVPKYKHLDDVGIKVQEAKRYEKIAELPEEKFEEIIQETKAKEKELTEALMLSIAKRIDREIKIGEEAIELPKGKYRIIYADPPWEYHKTIGEGVAKEQYPTMKLEDIKEMGIGDIAAEDSILFLWVTFPCLKEGLEVMDAWGFEYKTCAFNWIKLNKNNGKPFFGIGHYTKSNSELCLIGIKGKGLPIIDNTISQIIMTEKGKHSKKPSIIKEKIVQLVGKKKRIELFARQETKGWDSWGNEVK